jgi:hypothetical protein
MIFISTNISLRKINAPPLIAERDPPSPQSRHPKIRYHLALLSKRAGPDRSSPRAVFYFGVLGWNSNALCCHRRSRRSGAFHHFRAEPAHQPACELLDISKKISINSYPISTRHGIVLRYLPLYLDLESGSILGPETPSSPNISDCEGRLMQTLCIYECGVEIKSDW